VGNKYYISAIWLDRILIGCFINNLQINNLQLTTFKVPLNEIIDQKRIKLKDIPRELRPDMYDEEKHYSQCYVMPDLKYLIEKYTIWKYYS